MNRRSKVIPAIFLSIFLSVTVSPKWVHAFGRVRRKTVTPATAPTPVRTTQSLIYNPDALPYSIPVLQAPTKSLLGAAGADGFSILQSSGYVETSISVPNDLYQIQVVAYGTSSSTSPNWNPPSPSQWPSINVTVNGTSVGSAMVSSFSNTATSAGTLKSYTSYPYPYLFQSGKVGNTLRVRVTASGNGKLYLKYIRIVPLTPPLVLHAATMMHAQPTSEMFYADPVANIVSGYTNITPSYGSAGEVHEAVSIKNSGDYVISVAAWNHGFENPDLRVEWDGNLLAQYNLNTGSDSVFRFTVAGATVGYHSITIKNGTPGSGNFGRDLGISGILVKAKKVQTITRNFFGQNMNNFLQADKPICDQDPLCVKGSQPCVLRTWGRFAWQDATTWGSFYPNYTYDYAHGDVVAIPTLNSYDYLFTYGDTPGDMARDLVKHPRANGWGTYVDPADPTQMSIWKDFVVKNTQHYGKRVNYYELWNEANGTDSWTGTAYEMFQLAQAAYPLIKSNNSSAVVLSPNVTSAPNGMTRPEAFMRGYFAYGGTPYADILSIHGYVKRGEDVLSQITDFEMAATEFGLGDKAIWETECGWGPDNNWSNGSDQGDGALARSAQAAFVAPYHLIQMSENIERSLWFGWSHPSPDMAWDSLWTVDSNWNRTGITPAGTAYLNLQRWTLGSVVSDCRIINQDANLNTWACTISGTTQGKIFWRDTVALGQNGITDPASCSRSVIAVSGLSAQDIMGTPVDLSSGKIGVGCWPILVTTGTSNTLINIVQTLVSTPDSGTVLDTIGQTLK